MAKFRFKLKKSWKSLVSVTLAGVALFGAIFGLVALSKKISADTKEIYPTYSVGGLGTNGKYEETEKSIYTKTAFECQGLKITPDFDSAISYQVFFYDANEQFLKSTLEMTEFYEGAPSFAKYARIEITPHEDEKVSWYEVNKYAKQITVEVRKNQEHKAQDVTLNFASTDFKIGNFTETWKFEDATNIANRAILNMYVPLSGTDAYIHLDDSNYVYKYAIFKGNPSDDVRLAGTGFVEGSTNLVHFIDDEAIYYIAIGFEKVDKSDFTEEDFKNLAKAFTICYNG